MHLTQSEEDRGFTLIELLLTMLIMGVVLAVAGSILFSLSETANRNSAMVTSEQSASTIMTQLSRDIRSASTISFPTSSPSTEVEFADNVVTAGSVTTTNVVWSYSGSTLARSVQSGAGLRPTPYSIKLGNTAQQPVFEYFTFTTPTTPLPASDSMFEFSKCSTFIRVDLVVSKKTDNLASSYEESSQVALTNELNVLTAPGNGYCL